MSCLFGRLILISGLMFGILAGSGVSVPETAVADQSAAELLPAETFLYFHYDGTADHEAAFEKTAAYQSLVESGLADLVQQFMDSVRDSRRAEGLIEAIEHVKENGITFALAIDPPSPGPLALWGMVVAKNAGQGVDLLASLIEMLEKEELSVKQTQVKGRRVKYIQFPNSPFELGWWEEENDLVLSFGMNAIANAIAVAEEKRPNLTTKELFSQYATNDNDEFEVDQVAWLDFKSLRVAFEETPVPVRNRSESVRLGDLLKKLGLHNLDYISQVGGFRDDALWAECTVSAPGERTGLLSLLDQPTFTIEDLPAIPLQNLGVTVLSFDWGNSAETILEVVNVAIDTLDPESSGEVDRFVERFTEEFKFSPLEFLNSLGSLNCFYTDASQGVFNLGSVFLLDVDDAELTRKCLLTILERIVKEVNKQERDSLRLKVTEKEGETLINLELLKFPLLSPTFSLSEDWLIVGVNRQAIQAQRRRMDGTIFSWSIQSDLEDVLELMPSEMTSLSVSDPAKTYAAILGIAPIMKGFIELGLREQGALGPGESLPFDFGELPPSEMITEPLFFNVTIGTVDEDGMNTYSRRSLPTFFLFGENSKKASGGASLVQSGSTVE
ncbi:hypothetical protein [Planctomicrobium sp. SH527]|uniref:hypothetical protein n=1 Tax=Planctomicrobium sp. SH527 TaxID=3448123 RepID=UPI003F5B481E